MAPEPHAVEPGELLPRRFARYLLFDKVGEGGMARIYLARAATDLGGKRLVVVKEILPVLTSAPEFSRMLIDEAKLSAQLSHRNIVQVTDLGREGESLYIAMEYVEGLDLRDLLRACSRHKVALPLEFSLYIVAETLRALDYAHRKKDEQGRPLGIVHRDVSPSNVLLSVDGEVKLCDFGIARAMTSSEALPEAAVQGKAGYMSPEAARGEVLDARADVFAAGIILHELLSGRRLYRGEGGRPVSLEQARAAEVPPLPLRGYPDEERLHAIVMRALAVERDARYPSAEAMLADLEGYITQARMLVSSLRFGEWLVEHFGAEIIERRRARELAAAQLEQETSKELLSSPLPLLRPTRGSTRVAASPGAASPGAASLAAESLVAESLVALTPTHSLVGMARAAEQEAPEPGLVTSSGGGRAGYVALAVAVVLLLALGLLFLR